MRTSGEEGGKSSLKPPYGDLLSLERERNGYILIDVYLYVYRGTSMYVCTWMYIYIDVCIWKGNVCRMLQDLLSILCLLIQYLILLNNLPIENLVLTESTSTLFFLLP